MASKTVVAITAAVRRRGFVLRWVAAVTISLTLVSVVQYSVASRQLEVALLRHAANDFDTHLEHLEASLQAATTPEQRLRAVTVGVKDLSGQDGVAYVGVFDARGATVLATDTGQEQLDARDLEDVVGSERTLYRPDEDSRDGEPRYMFVLPIRTPRGVLAVKIEQRSALIGQALADLRKQQILGLLAMILFAVPLSYLLGGHTLRRRHHEADRLAGTDELTGIPGRRPFRPLLSAALADPDNSMVSLALIDIDHFKRVNDTLGHSYGDRVLVALGESFDALRATDTAFRLGGDEFAVLLPNTTDGDAADILERVRTSFTARMPAVTISCGVASARSEDTVSLQELWERADSALYQAKRLGRDRTVAFSNLTVGVTVAADKLDAVHDLCDSGVRCSIAFQPIWDLRAGSLLGHEALLRLPSSMPLDGPAEAFELADRIGKAAVLDALARAEVLRAVEARPWPGGLLFINVHPAALREFDFDAFAAQVIDAGLSQTDIVLEITEQADLDNPTNLRALKRASARGFKLALDDLGAGNAGLRALTHVQFHIIKLDRQVISRVGIDPAADAVVAAATTFVRNTGGWVVAEGIEDTSMLEAVLDDSQWRASTAPPLAGQGYLLGHPASIPRALDTRLNLLDHPLESL